MIMIAGPVVIDDVKSLYTIGRELKSILAHFPNIEFYFKASCVKDNRKKLSDYHGPGFQKGMIFLQEIGKHYNFKTATDFYTPEQIRIHSKYIDLIQIPSNLAQQTSVLKAAAETGKPINIKKPQSIGPHHILNIFGKIFEINKKAKIFITDCGTCFGYDYSIFDPRHIKIMRSITNKVKFLVDVTRPNNQLEDYTYAHELGVSGIVSGADGVVLDTHDDVMLSKCAENTQIPVQAVWEYINAYHVYYNITKKVSGPEDAKYFRSEDRNKYKVQS